ncbi:TonB-dependent receptor domain-containing protein [Sphingomonas fennica]|uniref:TonB-dependent receptor n=1 Tax=Edaphosphingomonas fennica TaxID=114404 RepID=A0A2T4I582_9SPHN|nr:TonB-dependent receptor [Sphingomonas fennica]PTD25157.1 TonB-dependent receptor [Sphingomonas fennica]
MKRSFLRGYLYSATAFASIATACAVPASAQTSEQLYDFNIPSQSLGGALNAFARASHQQITFDPAAVREKQSPALTGQYSARDALDRLLANSGLTVRVGRTGIFIVEKPATPRPSKAEAQNPDLTPAETLDIVVTAQKREEKILDVPIAVSAFSGTQLDRQKIESGADLVRGVPNLNFSKSFSSMYNIGIRGIGTKALNSSSDPGVAVSYNNTPLIRNRLFEQEFFDTSRLEVLRGPQGTLYGRNATGGVVNIFPALPTGEFEGELKGEVGNYETRRVSGMLNIPLTDTFSIRGAGAYTKREGFDYNEFTRNRVNGRDLWSTRLSAQWEPSDRFKANVIWEHFNEDDDRSRTGKALCTTDPGPEMVGSTIVPDRLRSRLSQGCLPGSLYDDAAFGVPNAASQTALYNAQSIVIGIDPNTFASIPLVKAGDPYAGIVQSRNPRRISTAIDPTFKAKNDIVQLNLELKIGESLTLISQSGYSKDRWYSSQDYNRFASNPIFGNTKGLYNVLFEPYADDGPLPDGFYTDPQLGSSDRLLTMDLNRTRTRQWTQEIRLQSDFNNRFNFNVGANYLNFKTTDDYYAFSNLFNLTTDFVYLQDLSKAFGSPPTISFLNCPAASEDPACQYAPYKDKNPLNSIDDLGHNYFLSRNNVKTKSFAIFGEAYYQATDDIKITLGARYTNDKKYQTQIPSQLLLSSSIITGGTVNYGYPALPDIDQGWSRFTGRAVIDWKPNISFTDDTLVYGSVSRGYKGGGANPPRVDFDPRIVQYIPLSDRYKPEGLTAFEIGTKNLLANNTISLNATAFFYDYDNYQISQVTDRITYTENFDAQTWGLELEATWQPNRNFRFNSSLGYLDSKLKKNAKSIDVMDRTQGNPDWTVVRPWLQVPTNCVAPTKYVEKVLSTFPSELALAALCPGSTGIGSYNPNIPPETTVPYWQYLGFTYDPLTEAPNAGRGFDADLGGNELPNSPHLTFNVGAQYTFFLDSDDWELTFRGDYYRQSKSYARVYNTEFDKLKGWGNLNISVSFARPKDQLAFQLYVKNALNDQPITDVFLSADDIGMPANTFYLDPRIIGFNITKKF